MPFICCSIKFLPKTAFFASWLMDVWRCEWSVARSRTQSCTPQMPMIDWTIRLWLVCREICFPHVVGSQSFIHVLDLIRVRSLLPNHGISFPRLIYIAWSWIKLLAIDEPGPFENRFSGESGVHAFGTSPIHIAILLGTRHVLSIYYLPLLLWKLRLIWNTSQDAY
jgi:hypothetical protein